MARQIVYIGIGAEHAHVCAANFLSGRGIDAFEQATQHDGRELLPLGRRERSHDAGQHFLSVANSVLATSDLGLVIEVGGHELGALAEDALLVQ